MSPPRATWIHNYIRAQRQEEPLALAQQAKQEIGMWTVGLRNNRREGVPGVVRLPGIDALPVVKPIPAAMRTGGGGGPDVACSRVKVSEAASTGI